MGKAFKSEISLLESGDLSGFKIHNTDTSISYCFLLKVIAVLSKGFHMQNTIFVFAKDNGKIINAGCTFVAE